MRDFFFLVSWDWTMGFGGFAVVGAFGGGGGSAVALDW